jgi:hypothetical protein
VAAKYPTPRFGDRFKVFNLDYFFAVLAVIGSLIIPL